MPTRSPRRAPVSGALIALASLVAGCASDAGSSDTGASDVGVASSLVSPTVPASVPTTGAAASGLPRVDLVLPAVQALEAQLGAPQDYFEINATSQLVNIIISLNNGAFAQNWLYLDGELTSKEPESAAGNTFEAAALDFDPAVVLAKIRTDLPDATPNLFLIEGGPNGAARYTAVVTSSKGGQLLVVVGADGHVIEVNPN